MKGGDYTVKQISDNGLQFRRADGTSVIVQAARSSSRMTMDSIKRERLVFRQYENHYFLAQVWLQRGSGRELYPGTPERRLMKELKIARQDATPLTVEISACSN